MTWPDGGFVDYGSGLSGYASLDAANRLVTAKYSDTTVLFGLAFNSLGQLTSLVRGPSGSGGRTTYTYDAAGRLASFANDTDGAATSNDVAWTFSYSPAGQVTNWGATSTVFDYKEAATTTVPRPAFACASAFVGRIDTLSVDSIASINLRALLTL